ncbi:hypothetical protein JCM3765_007729 [Sporobolomyces pararoseus]
MFSYFTSFFSSSPSQPTSSSSLQSTTTTSSDGTQSPSQPLSSSSTTTTSTNHLERNRKKRLAKKKSKQRRRQSTLNGTGGGGGGSDDSDFGGEDADEDFPDADDDLSYIPLEPDNTPSSVPQTTTTKTKRREALPKGAQPSPIPPTEVYEAVSRLPPLLPNGEKLPNDERAKRIIKSQGFVPVEDQDGGLHVGVQVREGIVAVLGGDGKPILFTM